MSAAAIPIIDAPHSTAGAVSGAAPSDAPTPVTPAAPIVFLVEGREEVSTRLAADLNALDVRIELGSSQVPAWQNIGARFADLVLVNLDQPDGSGLTFISQFRRLVPAVRIWAYAADVLPTDCVLADELDVEELIEYRGDLFRLSDEIVDRVQKAFGEPTASESSAPTAGHRLHRHRPLTRQTQPAK